MTPARLEVFLDETDAAYREVRRLVFDRVPTGERLRRYRLSDVQWRAMDRLERAERELAGYRASRHESRSSNQSATG
jgi:hypothetical protein